jgi:serine/threonine-protein kinase RIO1
MKDVSTRAPWRVFEKPFEAIKVLYRSGEPIYADFSPCPPISRWPGYPNPMCDELLMCDLSNLLHHFRKLGLKISEPAGLFSR